MRFAFTTLFLILFSTTAIAAQYNFMPPEDLKQRLGANEDLVIVDIQIEEEFNQHHIPGSIATYAYPVKNEEDRARLEPVVSLQIDDLKPLVIVCPREPEEPNAPLIISLPRGLLKIGCGFWRKGCRAGNLRA